VCSSDLAKEYKVDEVNSGICTCTLRAPKIQELINENAKNGWTFENAEAVVGRRCGCIPSPKLIVIMSKEI
jgi:hypothetical protein